MSVTAPDTTAFDTARAALGDALASLRNTDGGWPYYRGRRSRLEPTCWAMLATGVSFDTTPLAAWRTNDGLFVEPDIPHANYAFNGLAALAIAATAPPPLLAGVTRGLIVARGETQPRLPQNELDPSLAGWSWMAGTFSWVEPTAWCVLALKRHGEGSASDTRTTVGEQLLRNRVCRDGGWNYGNSRVFGQDLPGHVPPTAAAVMAMQDHAGDALVVRAGAFLESRGPAEGSTAAMALSALALQAIGGDASSIQARLALHAPAAVAFGNAANLAMAAAALTGASGPPGLRLAKP